MNQVKFSWVALALSTTFFTACEKENTPDPGPAGGNKPPIVLDCDYFKEDRILIDDPEAPVDYVITCKMPVRADIKVEPGVVIEFEQNAGIEIDDFNIPKASFSAIGTSTKPIILRGVKKEKGYWRGVFFNSSSPKNELAYVHLEDAGGQPFNSNNNSGGVIVYASAYLKMTNSKVINSAAYGLNAIYGESKLQLENNVFTNNKVPAVIRAEYIDDLSKTNSYSGNTDDFVALYGYATNGVLKPSVWKKIDVHYRVLHSFNFRNLVTIEPGVYIEFAPETQITVHESGGGIKAVGTNADPIIFTGTSKVTKAWKGIYIDSKHPENEIAYAEMQYSGLDEPRGNVWLWYESLLNIHNVKFSNINGCAINYRILSGDSNPNLTIGPNITVGPEGCEKKEY